MTLTNAQYARIRTATHEAGHAIAGVVLGGHLQSASIFDRPDADGNLGLTELFDVLDADPRVAYAGPWSEARFLAQKRGEPVPTRRALDSVMSGGGCNDALGLRLRDPRGDYRLTVPPLMVRCWPGIARLAARLYTDGTATHAHALDALGIFDARDASVALHHIARNGAEVE